MWSPNVVPHAACQRRQPNERFRLFRMSLVGEFEEWMINILFLHY